MNDKTDGSNPGGPGKDSTPGEESVESPDSFDSTRQVRTDGGSDPGMDVDGGHDEELHIDVEKSKWSDVVSRRTLIKAFIGFGIGILLILFLGIFVGWREIFEALEGAKIGWIALACVSTLICLALWSKSWQIVLRVVGIDVPYRKLVITYFGATFANYVTPLGQAGGEPFIAYVLSKNTEADYEESLASVVTADLLNLVPLFNFAIIGLFVVLFRTQLNDTAETLALGLVVIAVGVPAIGYLAWTRRDKVEAIMVAIIKPLSRHTSRVSVETVRNRIESFYEALERIASEPRQLAYASVFSYLGWFFFALPLYLVSQAIDKPINLLVVFFIVPASSVAGFVPLPGGLGAAEGTLAVLITALTGAGDGVAYAITLLYRLASYGVGLLFGALAMFYIVFKR